MKKAILGKKLGMTQIFTAKGEVVPVTVVEAGPMKVIQNKTKENDGYVSTVVAYKPTKEKNVNKSQIGAFKKAKVESYKVIREFKYDDTYEVGSEIKCDIFNEDDVVDVTGVTRGRGFTGVIQRWNASKLKMSHGTGPVHRHVGSIGANSNPSRVFKNKKMPGQYGHEQVTIQNLKIVRVDADRNILLVSGCVPGPKGSMVTIKEAVKG